MMTPTCNPTSSSSTTLLRCGRLFTGTGEQVIGGATVVIEKGRIAGVDRSLTTGPKDAEVIDASKHFVMPGLIDSHLHIIGAASDDFMRERFAVPSGLSLLRASRHVESLLAAGFTTVRDCGGTHALHLKRAVREGVILGPRIIAAGFVLTQTFGHCDDHYLPIEWVDHRKTGRGYSLVCDGADECRKATRYSLREGADFIKICTSGGIMSARDTPEHVQFCLAEIEAIVAAARDGHTFVASHAQNDIAIRNAILGGCRTIEHGFGIGDETVKLAKSRGTIFVPTLGLDRAIIDGGVAAGFDDWAVAKMTAYWEMEIDHTRRLYKQGVTMAIGSDFLGSPLSRMGKNARELTLLTQYCGLEAHEILVAATRNGATACGIDSETGTIEEGKSADLIIVNGDPLTAISVLEDQTAIKGVIKEGRVCVDRGL